MPIWQSVTGSTKCRLPTLPGHAGSQNSWPALGGTLHRACPGGVRHAAWVAACVALVLPLGCATTASLGRDMTAQPVAVAAPAAIAAAPAAAADPAPGTAPTPEPTIEDAQAMLAVARMAGTLQVPFADQIVDQLVRWQTDLRDRLHVVEVHLEAFAEQTGIIVPDLTVLSIEPVARTESSGFGWRDDPIRHTRSFHAGTDFRGQPGTPVMAAGDGVVKFCGRMG